ncbi:MAG: 5-(carboxyamino)imidazole ribonucleotide synthase [Acidimicrobiaceae bacterium]|nr:5-(carboxyamino)imidazole ribonucleotide synthase [Acidimicrobiaceae bacterium]
MTTRQSQAPLPPGSTIGVVGGGQLGRMLAYAAHQHGYRVAVLTGGEKDSPAGTVAEIEIAAAFDDEVAIERLLAESDVITWEFENVDVGIADAAVSAGLEVRPSGKIIATAQDRRAEKSALETAGVAVAAWRSASSESELETAVNELGLPVIAKAARFGYDGKGQARIERVDEVADVWRRLGSQRLVVESVVDFERELSVIVARTHLGDVVDHGVMENHHVNHILDSTVTPAHLSAERSREATAIAARIADEWDLVGVMCVEMFDAADGLIVNEVAPRPHNSGHCTIEAAPASQFSQQLRAAVGMPLGDGSCRPAAMVQLLGDLFLEGEPDWSQVFAANSGLRAGGGLSASNVHLHLYGKHEARKGRKMGHMTAVGDDPDDLLDTLVALRQALTDR